MEIVRALNWAEKAVYDRPFDKRIAVVDKWASDRAAEFDVKLSTAFLAKKDWKFLFRNDRKN